MQGPDKKLTERTPGPLRIFGLDVKKIYDMVKALWELFRDIMEIAEAIETICVIMLEVGGFVIGAAVGAAVSSSPFVTYLTSLSGLSLNSS